MQFKSVKLLQALIFACVAFFACNKEPLTELVYGIDPATQKDLLCRSLRLDGENIKGDMPAGIGSGSAIVINHPEAVEVSAGVLLFIPYQVNDPELVCQLYLQVEGADNYWETALTIDSSSQQPYFEILIPKFVRDGNFNLVFSVADCNGNVSPIYSTNTIVSPLSDCSSSISGSVGITVRAFDLGDKPGRAGFSYEMYTIPDRLDIRYNGKWVASTGTLFNNSTLLPNCNGSSNGFVSGTGTLEFDYDPSVSRFVEVYISGCNAGTEWVVQPVCPDDFTLVGIHTSVSSNSILVNIWNHGHAWITVTKSGKTSRYGLWPDYNDAIEAAGLSNGPDTDRRIDFEQGTGKFSRFKYISPEQMEVLEDFINKHWEYNLLTRNCATFAQKSWKVATRDIENLDANELWNGSPIESPRILGNSILSMEAIDPTGYLRPLDVPQVNDPLDSFN